MRPIIAIALATALVACTPQDPDGQTATPPADAPAPKAEPQAAATPAALPADFAGDLDAVGTEPFWSLAVRKETLTLTRPDQADVTTPAGTPQMQGAGAVWKTPALTLTLTKADCSDGMSDRKFPLTAQVAMGETTLKGCAGKAELPAPSE